MSQVFATKLESATTTPSKIDGMAAGEFMDNMGRVAAFKAIDLPLYVANTKKALAATVDGNGVLVGVPIDSAGHRSELAAGWIKDVELDAQRQIITFSVEWNELGVESITSNTLRYFSPEVDLRAKVIMGGALTNWPATRNKENEILLKPVTLSLSMFSLGGESLDAKVNSVCNAFYEAYAEYDYNNYPVEVFDTYLICHMEDGYWQAPYSVDENDKVSFIEMAAWKPVKKDWAERALEFFKKVLSGFSNQRASEEQNQNPEDVMFELDKLPPEQRTALLSQARDVLTAELSSASSSAAPELAKLIQTRIDNGVNSALAMEQRKQHVAQFSARAVSGTKELPQGLPVAQDKIEAIMLALPEDQQKNFEDVITGILEKGLVPFAELGHEKPQKGNREIPAEVKLSLNNWLGSKKTVEEFFAVCPELGDMSEYDLAAYQKKEA